MVTSAAPTVDAYLLELPPERRAAATAIRALVREHLPPGYEESMTWGMPSYEVPLARYPKTYNRKPLAYAAFAAQKQYFAIYLNMAYADSEQERAIREAYAAAGRRLDMGKCCLRFKRLDDLLAAPVAAAIASTSVEGFIAQYEASRAAAAR